MANTRPRFSNSDLTNAYFNAAKSTAATTGHLLLDSVDNRGVGAGVSAGTGGARHGHILQVLDIKNDSGVDGSIYLGGAFESQITDEQGDSDPDFLWGAGQWDNGDATKYEEDSTHAKEAAGVFELQKKAADGGEVSDGFVVHATRPFSCAVFEVGTQAVYGAGAVTHVWQYWTTESTWATLNMLNTSPTFDAAKDWPAIFAKPTDWGKTTGHADEGSIPVGRYAIRYQQTVNMPSTAATAARIYIGDVLRYPISLVDNTGAVHGHGVNWPLCAGDETPWAVFGTAASGWSVAIGTERHYSSQGLGDRR